MVAMFLGAVEGTVVTTAVPTIVKELHGFGGSFTTLTIVVQSSVDFSRRGAATASNSLVRTLGQIKLSQDSALHLIYAVIIIIAAANLVLAFVLPKEKTVGQ